MKVFRDNYTIEKISKTNGTPWCIFEDKFGYTRCALITGEWSEGIEGEKYNCVVVNEGKQNVLVVMAKSI